MGYYWKKKNGGNVIEVVFLKQNSNLGAQGKNEMNNNNIALRQDELNADEIFGEQRSKGWSTEKVRERGESSTRIKRTNEFQGKFKQKRRDTESHLKLMEGAFLCQDIVTDGRWPMKAVRVFVRQMKVPFTIERNHER